MKGLRLSLFLVLALAAAVLSAKAEPDFYFTNYTRTELWFLNRHYTELENGRMVRLEGTYQGHQWKKPYAYRESLKALGKSVKDYNVLQMTLREVDGVTYAFPLLLVRVEKGAMPELDALAKGQRVALYGLFYRMKDADYAIETHVLEAIHKGGRDIELVLDGRMTPTPTPTPTVTPTPGPNLWKRLQKKLKPATPQPTGTVTPEALPTAK